MSDRRVVGGRAHLTGVREKGPQGPKAEDQAGVKAGTSAGPSDGWYEFDCTPKDAEGKDFGPMPAGETENPDFDGVPTFDGADDTQALRLKFDYTGDGSADLVHEYANHGCTPRIKTRGAHGQITNLRFEAADGVTIPVEPPTIQVGAANRAKPRG